MSIITQLHKKDFIKILEYYDIGRYSSHKHIPWALSNTVYILQTTKRRFVLKIFETPDLDFIKFQIKIMQLIEKEGLPSPRIIYTRQGAPLLIFNNKILLIQEFVKGREPKKFNDELIIDIAIKQARMNNILRRIKTRKKYGWEKDYQFKPINTRIQKYRDFNIKLENNKFIKELRENIKKKKLRVSVIHGDFHGANLLVEKNKLKAILDWDDAHKDFIAQEIATFIAHTFIEEKTIEIEKLKLYLNTYEKLLKLNREERKAIYFFIKHRFLSAITWHIDQLKKHRDRSRNIERFINRTIKKYRNFDKFPLGEFIHLFENVD